MKIEVKIISDKEESIHLNINNKKSLKVNIDYSKINMLGSFPDKISYDLLHIGTIVYSLDRHVSRKTSLDAWTRIFDIKVPVSNPSIWDNAKPELQRCLNFLSGDKWIFSFEKLESNYSLDLDTISNIKGYDAVSLFSGGLDSLIGVINYLEENPDKKIVLTGHHDIHMPGPKSDQEGILEVLKEKYPDRIFPFLIYVGIKNATETTLRSRSFLFISMGIFTCSFLEKEKQLIIPENGTISLNIPLSPSRRGTCSTRTTHPHYLQLFNNLLNKLEISTKLHNPFQFLTKGEIVESCLNQDLLKITAPISVSCGKRGHVVHWERKNATECGKCMPCIYRRAALHKIGLDNEIYGNDICKGEVDPRSNSKGSNDLRAMLLFIKNNLTKDEIIAQLVCNGSLDSQILEKYSDMIIRTRTEIKQLLKDKSINTIKSYAGIR